MTAFCIQIFRRQELCIHEADLLTWLYDLWYKILVKRKCISQINIIWTTLFRAAWQAARIFLWLLFNVMAVIFGILAFMVVR